MRRDSFRTSSRTARTVAATAVGLTALLAACSGAPVSVEPDVPATAPDRDDRDDEVEVLGESATAEPDADTGDTEDAAGGDTDGATDASRDQGRGGDDGTAPADRETDASRPDDAADDDATADDADDDATADDDDATADAAAGGDDWTLTTHRAPSGASGDCTQEADDGPGAVLRFPKDGDTAGARPVTVEFVGCSDTYEATVLYEAYHGADTAPTLVGHTMGGTLGDWGEFRFEATFWTPGTWTVVVLEEDAATGERRPYDQVRFTVVPS